MVWVLVVDSDVTYGRVVSYGVAVFVMKVKTDLFVFNGSLP